MLLVTSFILIDDNARPHRAHVVTDYLENETIEWPSCSPDMNPIEHGWDMLQEGRFYTFDTPKQPTGAFSRTD